MTNNTTDANEQGMSCILTEDPMEAKICKALAYSLLLVFSLLGNTLIIMVVCGDDKMKTTTNLLIVNMAVSDLLVPIFAMPRANVEIFYGNLRWLIDGAFGEALCKLTAFFQDISTAVSVQSLVAISVERFYAVWFPLKAIRIKPRVRYIISLIWFTSLLIHVPYLYGFRIGTFSGETYCYVAWPRPVTKIVFLLLIIIIYIIPLGVITTLYSLIVSKLRGQSFYGVRNLVIHFSQREKRNRNVLKMSLAIIVVFFLSMSPFVVYLSIDIFSNGRACLSRNFRFITQYLVHCNGALNFFTYFTFNQSYRRGFSKILSRVFCSCFSFFGWRKEVDLSHHLGLESYGSHATVNTGLDCDSRNIVLTRVLSLEKIEPKFVENGRTSQFSQTLS